MAFSEADQLTGLYFSNQKKQPYLPSYQFITLDAAPPLFKETDRQVNAYFNLALRQFDLPLHAKGSEFQQQVWQQLKNIPYGETVTYKWMADQLKKPKAVRAIAQAIGKNPLILCNPCHRVIAASGKLAGYSAGIEKKAFLLHLESSN
ncbi:methylated-DNA--[protein]-cysteine S-methyltransferase [Motilimonas sp. E26]|uniref:methylated-DNA--[protein]-cysteine S-methyltransferase n=1 Tax=Motilimonas sp. E26 TaxID=2865674 RepID=UPI001E4B44C9|nr:methylated-DNA--[protein]-cysteine S-methyltransferase [Motilimonas sp. E26]